MNLAQHSAAHEASVAHTMALRTTNPMSNLHPFPHIIPPEDANTLNQSSTSAQSRSTGQRHADDLLGKCITTPTATNSNPIESHGNIGKHQSKPQTKIISSIPR